MVPAHPLHGERSNLLMEGLSVLKNGVKVIVMAKLGASVLSLDLLRLEEQEGVESVEGAQIQVVLSPTFN